MIQELLYTSHEGKGLRGKGGGGFCTVLSTEGMAPNLATALERLSGYKHPFDIHDQRSAKNPTNYRHALIYVGGVSYHVLSRIADLRKEHTGRSNKLAHHIAIAKAELPESAPTWLMVRPNFFRTDWDGEVKLVPARSTSDLPSGDSQVRVCSAWQAVTGDAGWAGVVANHVLNKKDQPISVIYAPGVDTLKLINEVSSLLPAARQWEFFFSTYFTTLPAGTSCHLRFFLDGTSECEALRRDFRQEIIDLAGPLGEPEKSSLVTTARTGEFALSPAHASSQRSIRAPAASSPPLAERRHELNMGIEELARGEAPSNLQGSTREGWNWKVAALFLIVILMSGTLLVAGIGIALWVGPSMLASTSDDSAQIAQADLTVARAVSDQESPDQEVLTPSVATSTEAEDKENEPNNRNIVVIDPPENGNKKQLDPPHKSSTADATERVPRRNDTVPDRSATDSTEKSTNGSSPKAFESRNESQESKPESSETAPAGNATEKPTTERQNKPRAKNKMAKHLTLPDLAGSSLGLTSAKPESVKTLATNVAVRIEDLSLVGLQSFSSRQRTLTARPKDNALIVSLETSSRTDVARFEVVDDRLDFLWLKEKTDQLGPDDQSFVRSLKWCVLRINGSGHSSYHTLSPAAESKGKPIPRSGVSLAHLLGTSVPRLEHLQLETKMSVSGGPYQIKQLSDNTYEVSFQPPAPPPTTENGEEEKAPAPKPIALFRFSWAIQRDKDSLIIDASAYRRTPANGAFEEFTESKHDTLRTSLAAALNSRRSAPLLENLFSFVQSTQQKPILCDLTVRVSYPDDPDCPQLEILKISDAPLRLTTNE